MPNSDHPCKPSITEVARRYHACVLAVATTLGITLEEALNERREVVTAVFVQASREGLKLDAPPAPPASCSPAAVGATQLADDGRSGRSTLAVGMSPAPWPREAVFPCVQGLLASSKPTIAETSVCETCQNLKARADTPLAHFVCGGRMYSPKIREELIPRLYKIGRARGLPMTTVVNCYLEACLYYEEQRIARGQSLGQALDAVLALAMLQRKQERGTCMNGGGSNAPGTASPSGTR